METTLIYTHLIDDDEVEYVSAIAKTVEEARKLIEEVPSNGLLSYQGNLSKIRL